MQVPCVWLPHCVSSMESSSRCKQDSGHKSQRLLSYMFTCSLGVVLRTKHSIFLHKILQSWWWISEWCSKQPPKHPLWRATHSNSEWQNWWFNTHPQSFQWVNCIEKEIKRNSENKADFIKISWFLQFIILFQRFSPGMNGCNFPFSVTNGVFIFLLLNGSWNAVGDVLPCYLLQCALSLCSQINWIIEHH